MSLMLFLLLLGTSPPSPFSLFLSFLTLVFLTGLKANCRLLEGPTAVAGRWAFMLKDAENAWRFARFLNGTHYREDRYGKLHH